MSRCYRPAVPRTRVRELTLVQVSSCRSSRYEIVNNRRARQVPTTVRAGWTAIGSDCSHARHQTEAGRIEAEACPLRRRC
jgi:hypothetical protein